MTTIYSTFLELTIRQPEKLSTHFTWLAPLLARIVIGQTFLVDGWGKLNNLDIAIGNFVSWGIPLPQVLTPFVAGTLFIGGAFLIVGLLTRVAAGLLGIIMAVAIYSALWPEVTNNSITTLFNFRETAYLAIFTWLAVAGAGKVSIDYWLTKNQSASE